MVNGDGNCLLPICSLRDLMDFVASPPVARAKKRRTVVDDADEDAENAESPKAGVFAPELLHRPVLSISFTDLETSRPLLEAMTRLKTSTTTKKSSTSSATTGKKAPPKRPVKTTKQPIEEEEEDGASGIGATQSDHEMEEADEADPNEEEGMSELEDDEEDVSSKTVELALNMTRDVDINGGWEAGAPYVT